MNEYRKKIKNRMILLSVGEILSIIIVIVGMYFAEAKDVEGGTFTEGMTEGFTVGLFVGFCGILLFLIFKCARGLKNEAYLRDMNISENDERKKMIRLNATGTSFLITLGVLVVAITVTSLYNTTVSITLMGVLSVYALIGAVLKGYFTRKY